MTDAAEPIKFAVVGCGRVSVHHFEAIASLDGTKLVGVCDEDRSVLDEVTAERDVAGFTSLDALLEAREFDVGVLATPTGLHAGQTNRLAETGRHVMTEKPMATRWSDAVSMVERCRELERHLFVVKQLRYNPTLQLAKRAIERGWLGEIRLVDLDVFWTRPQEYFDSADWRGTRRLDGGAFLNQTSHYFDLLTWLFGPVGSVSGTVRTLDRDIEVEDTGTAQLEWESGALGSVSVTLLTWPKNLEASLTILGDEGSIRIGGTACDRIDVWKVADAPVSDADIDRCNRETAEFYGDGHTRYYQNVVDVLRGGTAPDTNGTEGLKSLELITAAYASSRRGERDELPLPRDCELEDE